MDVKLGVNNCIACLYAE